MPALVPPGTVGKGGRRLWRWWGGGGGSELSEATHLLSLLDHPCVSPLKWLTLPFTGWFCGVKPCHGPSGWHVF